MCSGPEYIWNELYKYKNKEFLTVFWFDVSVCPGYYLLSKSRLKDKALSAILSVCLASGLEDQLVMSHYFEVIYLFGRSQSRYIGMLFAGLHKFR